jgi:Glucose / Sorbosone dehydrogenase/PEP-CTERM motif
MMCRYRVAVGFLCLLGSWHLCSTPSWGQNLRSGVADGDIEVLLKVVVERVLDPSTEFAFIDMAPIPDGTGRMAVSTINGTIRMLDAGGNLLPGPLMTNAQSAQFLEPRTPPNEAGMTGIAFHPDFNNAGTFGHGKLYTITSDRRSTLAGGVPLDRIDYSFAGHSYQMVLREWDLATFGNVPGNAASNTFTGTVNNSRELLRIAQPGKYHTLFDLAFNTSVGPSDPDYGNLYFTYGDGGDEGALRSPQDRAMAAQGLSTIYGKIHRIDPDPTANPLVRTSANTGQPAYSIPPDNPYNGDDATETRTSSTIAETWANGVRSPWRLTFDRGTGDLYLGDVGENQREEVNLIEKGKNYGWGQMEGTLDGTLIPGDGRLLPGLERPLVEMPRGTGSNSISGGFVYRGSAIPDLVGKYVFADLGQGYDSSAIFYAIVDPNDPDGEVGDVFEFKISPLSPKFEIGTQVMPERIFSIGEDQNGELYLVAGPDPRNAFLRTRPAHIIRLAAVPEPSTVLLVMSGLAVVIGLSRRGRPM